MQGQLDKVVAVVYRLSVSPVRIWTVYSKLSVANDKTDPGSDT